MRGFAGLVLGFVGLVYCFEKERGRMMVVVGLSGEVGRGKVLTWVLEGRVGSGRRNERVLALWGG